MALAFSTAAVACGSDDSANEGTRAASACVLSGAGHVRIVKDGHAFAFTRDGLPFFVKGVSGQANMDRARQAGANSLRTYESGNASSVLADAQSQCMTVMLGIDLSKDAEDYTTASYLSAKRNEVTGLLNRIKNHPALLAWALGDEINLGADTQAAWRFVGELTRLIHAQDPNHPVITVLAGADPTTVGHLVTWAPEVDALGINAFGTLSDVGSNLAASSYAGPYLVTEWGPTGHWESPTTSWDRPIELSSDEKAALYRERYAYVLAQSERALGSYVFYWGQKQERTPTWYSMFLETSAQLGLAAESTPAVDVMTLAWSGALPPNQAPRVSGISLDAKKAEDDIELARGQAIMAEVQATDPDTDPLTYVWEILREPTQLGSGGSFEPRPPRVGSVRTGSAPTLMITTPNGAGEYRLFVYVIDGRGHAGTANVPFRVN